MQIDNLADEIGETRNLTALLLPTSSNANEKGHRLACLSKCGPPDGTAPTDALPSAIVSTKLSEL